MILSSHSQRFAHRWIVPLVLFVCVLHAPVAADEETTPSLFSGYAETRLWNEIYYQCVFSSYDHNNAVSDLFYKIGVHWFQLLDKDVDLYLKLRFMADRNGDFWNNLGEVGPGMRYRPFEGWGLVLFHELVGAGYTRLNLPDEQFIPESTYWDYRAGLAFWQWWGRKPWKVEGHEVYLPFMGWREVYGDAIYFHRDRHNIISTISLREGLAMGKIGKLRYDAYLRVQAGIDMNRDYWNNYVKAGPGFRVTPFENLGVDLSVDYMKGMFYRGNPGLDDVSDTFRDLAVTLSWYHEF